MKDPKSVKKLMEDLGFNPQSKLSAKAAFIKHLAKAAYGVDLEIPAIFDPENSEHNVDSLFVKPIQEEQLELPFEAINKK